MTIAGVAAPERWALNGGPFGSKLVSSMYVPSGIPVIRGANLPLDARFSEQEFVYVTKEKSEELRQHQARPGDIVITQRGTLGQVGLIPENASHPVYVISQSQMKLTVNPEVADARFIYYLLKSPASTTKIIDLGMTSGVPHINLAILRAFEVTIPPPPTQRRIASVLAAYDDLIEVNRRRIAVSEEMTRRLFDEWFVRFRFPGHEGHELIEADGSKLPEGWVLNRLKEAALEVPLKTYLETYRAYLIQRRRPEAGDAVEAAPKPLWVSSFGRQLAYGGIYLQITDRTRGKFGKHINPHFFRDCAATSIAEEDPDHVHITASILGHTTLATSEKYYNQAQARRVTTDYQKRLVAKRKKAAKA